MSTVESNAYHFRHEGFCPACERKAVFEANGPYFRSTLRCNTCNSAPRHRAIMNAIRTYYPHWRNLALHESSPGRDIVSQRLATECSTYTATQFDNRYSFGSIIEAERLPCIKYRVEDLEHQTFDNEVFDLVITQDVFEHLFHPDQAIKEIARTLRPGGATIMTVPLVMGTTRSQRRAQSHNGNVINLLEPQFHGNPVSKDGSLVTIDWGYDISSYLQYHSDLSFILLLIEDIDRGLKGHLNEVLIGSKGPLANV